MTVDQLRQALADMPGHLPVHVKVKADEFSGDDWHWLYTEACDLESFPTQGRMAVIHINYEPR